MDIRTHGINCKNQTLFAVKKGGIGIIRYVSTIRVAGALRPINKGHIRLRA